MNETLINLLPFIFGSAIVPVQIIIILLFLKDQQSGLQKALVFLAGMSAVRLLQGFLFGQILNIGASATQAGGKSPVVSAFLLVLGILLLTTAYKKIKKEEDPDGDPPKWMKAIDSATISKAFILGIQLPLISPKLWVFILGAIGTITAAQLGQPTSFFTFVIFMLLAQALLILPIGIRLLVPNRAISVLGAASSWLAENNRMIVIVISLIFGGYFLYQGVNGLIG
jgi:hypothetical protein